MDAPPLVVVSTRSGAVESDHRVSVAVVDDEGQVVAAAGDPSRRAWWRSAAKIFQAAACVDDGAADAAGFDDRALALACASHSAEAEHLVVADAMLRGCHCSEDDLACGPHPSLSTSVARGLLKADVTLTPHHNNCSGKHAAMLALARHRGWDIAGYESPTHPVQQRLLDEVVRFSGLERGAIGIGVDNCRAVTFGLPLTAMATAWARAATTTSSSVRRLRDAMWAHPHLVAGTGRSCTAFLAAAPQRLLVKVGAEGVYCAAIPEAGLGLALKVDSGDARAAHIALCAVLRSIDERHGLSLPHDQWSRFATMPVKDTRGDVVGAVDAIGELSWR